MRFAALALSLVASLAIAELAGADLKHYNVDWGTIAEFNNANPQVNKYPPGSNEGGLSTPPISLAIIDDTNNGNPVLKRLLLVQELSTTASVPGSDGFIFLSMLSEQGPRKGLSFTGTGDTSTTIAWGLVTGWTVTGGFWCNSSPFAICGYAQGITLGTVEPHLYSTSYDLGTWTFHGTGFTIVPFVQQIAGPVSMIIGNNQYVLVGRLGAGIVPAVPVLGVALLGASLLLAGARLSRGR